jgi:hypothetical protein
MLVEDSSFGQDLLVKQSVVLITNKELVLVIDIPKTLLPDGAPSLLLGDIIYTPN